MIRLKLSTFVLIAATAATCFVTSDAEAQLFRFGRNRCCASACQAPAPSCCNRGMSMRRGCCSRGLRSNRNCGCMNRCQPTNNCCQAVTMAAPSCGCQTVVNPGPQDPEQPTDETCASAYNTCMSNCAKPACANDIAACQAYCQCVKNNCVNGSFPDTQGCGAKPACLPTLGNGPGIQ